MIFQGASGSPWPPDGDRFFSTIVLPLPPLLAPSSNTLLYSWVQSQVAASLSPDIARCLWACDCLLFPSSLEGTSPGSTSQTTWGCILHSSYLNTRLVYSLSPGLRIVLAGSLAAVNHKGRCCIWFLPYTCPSRAHASATAGGSQCCLHPQTKVLMPPVLIYCSQIQYHLSLISFPTYLPALFLPSQCTGGKTPHLLAAKAMHATSPVEAAEETTLAGLSPILPADSSFLIFPVELNNIQITAKKPRGQPHSSSDDIHWEFGHHLMGTKHVRSGAWEMMI